MDISAILKAVLAPGQKSGLERFEALRVGDQLTAKILQVESDGRLLIDLGRFRALAQINIQATIQAQPGQTLKLTVEQLGTPLQLRLAQTVSAPATKPLPEIGLTSLFTSNEQQQALSAIQRLVKSFPDQGLGGKLSAPLLQTEGGQQQATQVQSDAVQKPVAQAQSESDQKLAAQVQSESGQKATVQIQSETGQKLATQVQSEAGQKPALQVQSEAGQKTTAQMPSDSGMKSQITTLKGEAGEAPKSSTPSGAIQAQPSQNEVVTTIRPPVSTQQALLQLGVFLVKPSSDASVKQWIEALRVQLSDSGHLFEAKLAELAESSSSSTTHFGGGELQKAVARDLKPNLMILREALAQTQAPRLTEGGAAQRDIDVLRQTVDRLLSHVEQQQQRAVQRTGDQDPYQVFAHLLPVKEHPQPVRLKVYYPRKRAGGEGHLRHRIALLLDMDRLGPIRADVAMVGQLLSIRFFVRDQAVQERFDQHVAEVETVLSESFEQVDITTSVSEEKIAQFDREDQMGPAVGRIDVRA